MYREMVMQADMEKLGGKIVKGFGRYGVNFKITDSFIVGTRYIYEIKLLNATRERQIREYAKDIQLRLKLPQLIIQKENLKLRIIVSREQSTENSLLNFFAYPQFSEIAKKMEIPFVVGSDIYDNAIVMDVADCPHILLGGSTNSGKTVMLHNLLISATYTKSANLLIMDAGASDLTVYNGLPNLCHPVVTDTETAGKVLVALKQEMERRMPIKYEDEAEFHLLPRILCVIDEFPSLFSKSDKHMSRLILDTISSLLRLGRHSKVHLVLAAQNPTVQNMKCDLSNVTTRFAFSCAKANYSRTILDESGAENLPGKGAMLLKSPLYDDLQYIQGAYLHPDELEKVLMHIKEDIRFWPESQEKFVISEASLEEVPVGLAEYQIDNSANSKRNCDDKLLARIILWALEHETISCNMICNTFHLGYKRANYFLNKLHELEIAGEMYAKLPRAVLPQSHKDISDEALAILEKHGFDKWDAQSAIHERPL